MAWLGLHLVYLMGFRNRINVFVNWAWNYLTYDRGSRILRESERVVTAGDRPRLEPCPDASERPASVGNTGCVAGTP